MEKKGLSSEEWQKVLFEEETTSEEDEELSSASSEEDWEEVEHHLRAAALRQSLPAREKTPSPSVPGPSHQPLSSSGQKVFAELQPVHPRAMTVSPPPASSSPLAHPMSPVAGPSYVALAALSALASVPAVQEPTVSSSPSRATRELTVIATPDWQPPGTVSSSSSSSEATPPRRGRRGPRPGFGGRPRGRRGGRRVSEPRPTATHAEGVAAEDPGWSSGPFTPTNGPFTGSPGMRVNAPVTPLQFFQLFFTRELLTYFTRETNDYASFLGTASDSWFMLCNEEEMAKFLGLYFFMGVIHMPSIRHYWHRSRIHNYPLFSQVMSGRRFRAILKHFHAFNSRAIPQDNQDRLIRVRTVMQYLLQRFQDTYLPEENLSLDEGSLGWKGRLSFRVYNPMKPSKYAIKLYILAEASSGYIWNFEVYTGQRRTLETTVWGLVEPLRDQGYKIYMDNFYNSVSLCERLFNAGTYVCGTLRLARGAPKQLQQIARTKNLPEGGMTAMHRDPVMVLLWRDKRIVNMISTFHSTTTTEKQVRGKTRAPDGRTTYFQKTVDKPVVVEDYNQHMGGVDHFDQMIQYYPIQRRTVKWTKKITFYFVQMAMYNAFALYKKCSRRPVTLLEFLEEIVDKLLFFDDTEWPASGHVIHHAPDLPARRQARLPAPVAPAALPPQVPAEVHIPLPPAPPAAARPSPPGPSQVLREPSPVPGPSGEPAPAAMPGPAAAPPGREYHGPPGGQPAKRRRFVDHRVRLDNTLGHRRERIPGRRRLRCTLCSLGKMRRDTSHMCPVCDAPLCVGDCFERFHTDRSIP